MRNEYKYSYFNEKLSRIVNPALFRESHKERDFRRLQTRLDRKARGR